MSWAHGNGLATDQSYQSFATVFYALIGAAGYAMFGDGVDAEVSFLESLNGL